jgi:SAM-dependent methyltransferase
MSWFESWFDTPFYHILYKSRNYQEAQLFIDNIEGYLSFQKTDKILDLACGKGRHSIYLHNKGYDVTGIDLSKNSINYANQFANEKLHFFVHDMRESFRAREFDYVLNLFTSFGYFEDDNDNLKAVQAIAQNLKKGGRLVLDYMNSTKALKNLAAYYEKEVEGINFIITKSLENGFIVKNIDFEYEGQKHHFQERVKTLDFYDFHRYFEASGLFCEKAFGSYQLDDFDIEQSDRMIFVVRLV